MPIRFSIKHEFDNLSNMECTRLYGEKQKHFECIWRISIYRSENNFNCALEVLKNRTTFEATCESKLITSGGCYATKNKYSFKKFDKYLIHTSWDELKERLTDGKLVVEFNVEMENVPQQPQNVVLVMADRNVQVSKSLLNYQSSYFKSLISTKPEPKMIDVHDVYAQDLLNLLDVIYKKSNIDDNTLDGILTVASVYKFENVMKSCEQFLREKSGKLKNEKLDLAEKFGFRDLKALLTREETRHSDFCVISTESLQCTVCFEIFDTNPQMLQCGHTFCSSCVNNLSKINNRGYYPFNCPICRKPAQRSMTVPNFTLKSVLESIEELSRNEMISRGASDNTISAVSARQRQRLEVAEKKVKELIREKQRQETNRRFIEDVNYAQHQHSFEQDQVIRTLQRENLELKERTGSSNRLVYFIIVSCIIYVFYFGFK